MSTGFDGAIGVCLRTDEEQEVDVWNLGRCKLQADKVARCNSRMSDKNLIN